MAEQAPFLIGAFLSLTGDCADGGDLSKKGIELAIDEVNANGGILGRPVQLILEDSREANSVNAVTAYRRLIVNADIHYIIGPSCTPAGLAVAPLAAKNPNIVLISPSIGLRQFNEAGENIFKLWPYDEEGPKLLAQYARKQGWKRAAIFSSQQTWSEAQGNFFEAEFERLGGEIVAKVEPLQGESDLRSSAMRLVTAKPEFVLLSNYTQFEIAAQELVRQGYRGPKLSTLMTEEKVSLSNGALDGDVSYGYEPASPKFLELFKAKYGKEPWGIGADTAYDAMHLYAKTINEIKTDNPLLVSKQLLTIKDYPGASGVLSIDTQGGVTRQPSLFIAKNNKIRPLQE
jgi:branched-chain amino acid transport system substrate-binding protein